MAGKTADQKEQNAAVQSTAKTPLFSKAQLLASQKYAARRDLLTVLLEDGKTYAAAEVDALLEQFLNRRVKHNKKEEVK